MTMLEQFVARRRLPAAGRNRAGTVVRAQGGLQGQRRARSRWLNSVVLGEAVRPLINLGYRMGRLARSTNVDQSSGVRQSHSVSARAWLVRDGGDW